MSHPNVSDGIEVTDVKLPIYGKKGVIVSISDVTMGYRVMFKEDGAWQLARDQFRVILRIRKGEASESDRASDK